MRCFVQGLQTLLATPYENRKGMKESEGARDDLHGKQRAAFDKTILGKHAMPTSVLRRHAGCQLVEQRVFVRGSRALRATA